MSRTWESDTQSIRLEAPYETIFDFLADPANLPAWAVHFCQGTRRDGGAWRVTTPEGEVGLRVAADRERGTIDYAIEPAPGVSLPAHTRLLRNGEGAEYVFTQYRFPEMPEAQFRGQIEALREELAILAQRFSNAGEPAA